MGLGTILPDPSAMFDMTSTTKGFLMPRMNTAQRNAIAAPANGLMIFNIDLGVPQVWSDASGSFQWDAILTTGSNLGWLTVGNGGLVDGTDNFFGTLDPTHVRFITDNTERMRLTSGGELGIGTSTPAQRLHVDGVAGTPNVRMGSLGGAGNAVALGANESFVIADGNGDLEKRAAGTVINGLAWSLTGNSGTTAGTNFLGTTDNVALNIRTNNVDRMIFNTNGSIQRDVGGNARGTNAIDMQTERAAVTQVASGLRSIVAGGERNTASGDRSVIGGGNTNTASGLTSTVSGGNFNTASGSSSTVGGGSTNTASGSVSIVGGGSNNTASGANSTVGGGSSNTASGVNSTVGGGTGNTASGDYAAIPGGRNLFLTDAADRSFGFLSGVGINTMAISVPDVAVFGNADLWLANNDNAASQLRFYEANGAFGNFPGATNYTSFEAGAQTGDINYVLPLSTTATTTVEEGLLQLDAGTGQLSWVDPATAATTFAWSLTGNSGTIPGTNFIGTTDNVALHIRTNNVDRLIFNTNGSIQRDAGGDARGDRAIDLQTARVAATQVASGPLSVIGGGIGHTASGIRSTVSGGELNTASGTHATVSGGVTNTASNTQATVGGGANNTASALRSTVGGGSSNTASADYSSVSGGESNSASGVRSHVSGGQGNTASGILSTVGGGSSNVASTTQATVGGGGSNTASGTRSTISGGELNTASGVNSTVGGGRSNTASGLRSVVSGGESNTALAEATVGGGFQNSASGLRSTVAGGASNTASTDYASVSGGESNQASGVRSHVSGGQGNTASGILSTVGGGSSNVASTTQATVGGGGSNTASGTRSTVSGGELNTASGVNSTVGGGRSNTASIQYAVVSGGESNTAAHNHAVVAGGRLNTAGGLRSTIGGGEQNSMTSDFSTISGGAWNVSAGNYTAIPGGRGLTLTASADQTFGYLSNTGSNDMTISAANTAVFGNADLWLANNDNGASQLRFYEANGTTGAFPPGGVNYTSFQAGAQGADINYTLPTSLPAVNGEVMTSSTGGVMSWTSDPTLTSLRLNGATSVTNSRIVINEGHWTSQGTAPTAAGDGANLAAGVTVAAPSTDVAGLLTATDGGAIGTGVITVTYNAAYASTPVVTVTAANATSAGSTYFVSNMTTTSFDLNISTTSGNGADTYIFTYQVIEVD